MVRSNTSVGGKILLILITMILTLALLAGVVFIVYKKASVRSIAGLFGAEFRDCKMLGSSLASANLTAFTVSGGDWRMTSLPEADFSGRKMEGIRFCESDLRGCRFDRAVLRGCDFTGSDIRGASFLSADLRGCVLERLSLLDGKFKGAKIDLRQAVLFAEALGLRVDV